MDEKEPDWLKDIIHRMDKVYRRFGRDGLKDFPIDNVSLLLASKELALRDMPRGNLTQEQLDENRTLELQVRDLTGYVNSRLTQTTAHLSPTLRRWREEQQNRKPQYNRGKDRGMER